jgi:sugar phosphate isomerase/epimerase
MFMTRTGNFGIGFRRGWSDWQKDIDGLLSWAKAQGFAGIDLGGDAAQVAPKVAAAGLQVGSADLLEWKGVLSADKAKRADALARNAANLEACARFGIRNFFTVLLPENPAASRVDNFKLAITCMQELAPILERFNARIVIEGWPGPGALCCNPETYRGLFREVPSSSMGINYDPSHLMRMGIDPIRFLSEFAPRVHHVHGKDCEILTEALYEVGHEQGGVLTPGHGFGGTTWRYTIPGHGQMRWPQAFSILKAAGYKGLISIELEDENFNVSTEGEQNGLLYGAQFLAGC